MTTQLGYGQMANVINTHHLLRGIMMERLMFDTYNQTDRFVVGLKTKAEHRVRDAHLNPYIIEVHY